MRQAVAGPSTRGVGGSTPSIPSAGGSTFTQGLSGSSQADLALGVSGPHIPTISTSGVRPIQVCVHLLTLIAAELPLGVPGQDIPTMHIPTISTPGARLIYVCVYLLTLIAAELPLGVSGQDTPIAHVPTTHVLTAHVPTAHVPTVHVPTVHVPTISTPGARPIYVCVYLLTSIAAELPLGVSDQDIPTTNTTGLHHGYIFPYIY